MEPIGAIAGLVDGVIDLFTAEKKAKYNRLPDWLSPKDFQKQERTADIILIGMFVVLIIVIIAIIYSAKRGSKIN